LARVALPAHKPEPVAAKLCHGAARSDQAPHARDECGTARIAVARFADDSIDCTGTVKGTGIGQLLH
jgi:hypothetical protein